MVEQDYEEFDLANEIDELDKFLKLSASVSTAEITLGTTADSKAPVENGQLNGISSSREVSVGNLASFKLFILSYLNVCSSVFN